MTKLDDLINDPDNIVQPYHEQTLRDMKEAVELLRLFRNNLAVAGCNEAGYDDLITEADQLLERLK